MAENKKANEKPVYKLSASLINAYLYHMNNFSDNSEKSLMNSLQGVYQENKWTVRGTRYEREVAAGMHKQISDITDPIERQVWADPAWVIEFPKFKLRVSGKADAIDKSIKTIYDTKRVDKYFDGKYSDDNTIQHNLYFYLFPWAEKFVYLIASGYGDTVEEYHTYTVTKPDPEELRKKVLDTIIIFLNYLRHKGLWETYTKNQRYFGKY